MTRRNFRRSLGRRMGTALAALLVSGLLAAPALAHGEGYGRRDHRAHRELRGPHAFYGRLDRERCGFHGERDHWRAHRWRGHRHDRVSLRRPGRRGVAVGVIPGAVVQLGFGWTFPR